MRTCRGCAGPLSGCTAGCITCYRRQWDRGHRMVTVDPDICRGCGCLLDEFTDGCRTCYYRRYMRKRAAGLPTASTRPPSTAYFRRHERMWEIRGKASTHLCWRCLEDGTSKTAEQWATIHGEDGLDPWADYVPLCVPCHAHYDRDSRSASASWRRYR